MGLDVEDVFGAKLEEEDKIRQEDYTQTLLQLMDVYLYKHAHSEPFHRRRLKDVIIWAGHRYVFYRTSTSLDHPFVPRVMKSGRIAGILEEEDKEPGSMPANAWNDGRSTSS